MIPSLERDLAAHASDTLAYQFARAKLNAILGDIATASASLQDLLLRCNDSLPDDDFIFTNVLHIALLACQLDLAGRILNRRFRTDTWFRVMFDDCGPGDVHLLALRIDGRSSALFSINDQIRTVGRFDVVVGRWIAILRLFAAYYHHGLVETGDIRINLGDGGEIWGRPGLAFCDNRPDYFLIPDPYYLTTQGYKNIRVHFARTAVAWTERLPIAFWRGTSTGDPSRSNDWRLLPRIRLCEIGRKHRGIIDAGLSGIVQMDTKSQNEVVASGLLSSFVPAEDFNKFRYHIDIDGNTNSWPGLFQKLLTGSPVIKVDSPCGFRQWYYHLLKPWINFVPVAADMSDLVDKIGWLREHDDAARAIGEQGQALALSLEYERELQQAGRTIAAALRYFAGQPETELRFGPGRTENACLSDGWSSLPDGSATALGFESRLKLPRPVATGDFVLSLDVAPVAEPPVPVPQRVVVIANGDVLLDAKLAERQILHCPVSQRITEMDKTLSVTLLHPDAHVSASAEHPLDGRTLSIELYGVSLTAARVHAPQRHLSALADQKEDQSTSAVKHIPNYSMPGSALAKQLLTCHGTIVFSDRDSGQLRHGSPACSPANVFLVANSQTAYLVRRQPDGTQQPISVPPAEGASQTSRFAHDGEASSKTFHVMHAAGSVFGLVRAGLFLCAEIDGRVTLSRRQFGLWEQFQATETSAHAP